MRRRTLAVALCLALLFVVTASSMAAEKLVLWHWNTPERQAVFDPLLEEFTKQTGIELEVVTVGWADMKEKVMLSAASGVGPDVTMFSTSWFEDVAREGTFLDLDPLMKEFEVGDFVPAALQAWQLGGVQYALPFDMDIPLFYYNKTMFTKAGLSFPSANWTWDSWLNDAKKLTKDEDGDKKFDQYGWSVWFINDWLPLVWANDGAFFTNGQPSWNTANVRDALEFYGQFFSRGSNVTLTWNELAHVGIDPAAKRYPPHAFPANRLGMLAGGAWYAGMYLKGDDGKWNTDFGIAHWPLAPAGKRATTVEGQGVAILKNTKYPEAALKLVKWITGREYQTASSGLGQMPVRYSVLGGGNFLSDWPKENRKVVVETAGYARPLPMGVNWTRLVSTSAPSLRATVYDYLFGRQGLDAALETLDTIVPPLLPGAEN